MKKEPTTIQELRGMARYVNHEFDNLCRDWKGRTWEEAHMIIRLKIIAGR